MQKIIFILFLSNVIIGRSQSHLIVKSNHFNQNISESSILVNPICDNYYLISSSKAIPFDENWEFSVSPKFADRHISFETNELIIRTNKDLTMENIKQLKSFGEVAKNPYSETLFLIETMDKTIEEVLQKKQSRKKYY